MGAGGNAGNQSSIKVIRGLATGSLDTSPACIRATLVEQAAVGVLLGGALSAAGAARVYLTSGSLLSSAAIGLSVLGIVATSCLLGSGLPFALARGGVDPANAGTSIQVGGWRAAAGTNAWGGRLFLGPTAAAGFGRRPAAI